jgi:hypothetical protein
MSIARAIVDHRFLLKAFLGDRERETNFARTVAGGVDPGSARNKMATVSGSQTCFFDCITPIA